MMEKVLFVDPEVRLVQWCFELLKANGITSLKGLDTLKKEGDLAVQIQLTTAFETYKIALERVCTEEPIYRFMYKSLSFQNFTYYSAKFKLKA